MGKHFKRSIRKKLKKTLRKKFKRTHKKRTHKKIIKQKKHIQLKSDYQNLRLRYLRATPSSRKTDQEMKEFSYLQSLVRSLQKKQTR
jgi:hypothetical protein